MGGWTTADIPDLNGKRVIVTGANSGIGYHAALRFAAAGAEVVLACRNPGRGEAALQRIKDASPGAAVSLAALDLSSLQSVRDFAAAQVKEPLDLLINNAGVMAIPRAETADGFEMQLGTNHLGHFALTGLLLPALLERSGARVVTVGSTASFWGKIRLDDLMSEKKYGKMAAYGQAKLANLLFSAELGRREPRLVSVVAHPGYARTELMASAVAQTGSRIEAINYAIGGFLFAQSDAAGALPTVRAALDPAARSGEIYGPRFMMRGAPVKGFLSPRGRDQAMAAKLWDRSAELTGVRFG
ncbi:oxidoreductase [Actinocorallia longicatena]|uniref:Oxidoreductase n=1 Tax=Actinocorallia longicatena TaxID=111803 RepID=A0ABP6QLZ5_9ACTN